MRKELDRRGDKRRPEDSRDEGKKKGRRGEERMQQKRVEKNE